MEKETKVAAVSMKNITKTFGSVIANDKVNLDIYKVRSYHCLEKTAAVRRH